MSHKVPGLAEMSGWSAKRFRHPSVG